MFSNPAGLAGLVALYSGCVGTVIREEQSREQEKDIRCNDEPGVATHVPGIPPWCMTTYAKPRHPKHFHWASISPKINR